MLSAIRFSPSRASVLALVFQRDHQRTGTDGSRARMQRRISPELKRSNALNYISLGKRVVYPRVVDQPYQLFFLTFCVPIFIFSECVADYLYAAFVRHRSMASLKVVKDVSFVCVLFSWNRYASYVSLWKFRGSD